jgi:hypothetical protein
LLTGALPRGYPTIRGYGCSAARTLRQANLLPRDCALRVPIETGEDAVERRQVAAVDEASPLLEVR